MAAACRYFEEDAVYRINKKGNLVFGLVLENSEFVSSDEEDEKPNKDDEWERVKKGHVRVSWHPKGDEEVLQERKVYLADRSLMPGDVVRRVIKGRDTQRGYCRDVEVHSSVQIVGTRQVIYNVDSKDLTPLEEFSVDIAIFYDSWVGMVKVVKAKLYLKCFDGSRCILNSEEAELEDVMDKRERGTEFRKYDFYVGQQLWGPMHCFESAEWIHITDEMKSLKNKPSKNVRATVEEVKTVSLGVHWQCRAYLKDANSEGGDAQPQQPKFLLQGDDLKRVKMLNVFEPCTLQLGDRNYYKVKEDDLLLSKEQWRRLQRDVPYDQRATLNGPNSILKMRADSESDSKLAKEKAGDEQNRKASEHRDQNNPSDANDSEYEDLDEEDGNTSDTYSISSCSSVSSVGQGKKVKNRPTLVTKVLKNKKLKRARRRSQQDVVSIKPGDVVVVETLLTVSSADVVWQDGSVESQVSSTTLYPIHHLDDQEFFPGDFVVENKDNLNPHDYGVVKKVDHSGRTALVEWMKTYTENADPNPVSLQEQEVSVYDLKDHPDFKYRPGSVIIRVANFENEDPLCTAGQVLDVHPTGKVEVSWVNSQRAFCYPQDLYKVGEYDSEEGELWDDDSEDSDDSWETESELSVCEEASGNEGTEDDKSLRFKLAANIEKARVSMARLEELFTQNPALQTSGTMKQLLQVYKDCKYLDHLMGTQFFHESHFKGLLQRVRSHGAIRSAQRVAEQVSRLFKASPEQSCEEPGGGSSSSGGGSRDTGYCEADEDEVLAAADVTINGIDLPSAPCHCPCSKLQLPITNGLSHVVTTTPIPVTHKCCDVVPIAVNGEHEKLCVGDVEASQCPSESGGGAVGAQEDSDTPLPPPAEKPIICAKLCSMLMVQLLKAHEDVMKRFGGPTKGDGDMLDDSPVHPDAPPSVMEAGAVNGVAGVEEREAAEAPSVPVASGSFSMTETTPNCHHFKLTVFRSTDTKDFLRAVRKEIKLLSTSLPEGICVKGYEDRMDLFSFMIRGPAKTPYEDGLFIFDLNLPTEYPRVPPNCHYMSYCSDRLNPNLYEDGKVCVSLLGTWGGKGTEVWTSTSNLLQIIVSIQGLILVSEPYFNEAGYERQKGTQQGRENSRMYNEMVILKLVQSMSKLILTPPESFATEILEHFQSNAYKFIHRLEKWLEISEAYNGTHPTTPTTPTAFREIHGEVLAKLVDVYLPEFPLIPASKGFCITLGKAMVEFRKVLATVNIFES